MLGDSIARQVFHEQPVKSGAMEIVRLDTHGEPEGLADADLRRGGAGGEG